MWLDPRRSSSRHHLLNPIRLSIIQRWILWGSPLLATPAARSSPANPGPQLEGGRILTAVRGGVRSPESVPEAHARRDPLVTGSKGLEIDATIDLPKEPGGPTNYFKVVRSMQVLKHVARPSSLWKAAGEHIMLGGWLVLYTMQRTLESIVKESFVTQDTLGILRRRVRDWNN
ncbi:hypothetical protein HOY80DRAFT_1137571 [Tuber brumale]|nr:hypothetical protein HOY80DRAFT_1137571 [Tuber brumale]